MSLLRVSSALPGLHNLLLTLRSDLCIRRARPFPSSRSTTSWSGALGGHFPLPIRSPGLAARLVILPSSTVGPWLGASADILAFHSGTGLARILHAPHSPARVIEVHGHIGHHSSRVSPVPHRTWARPLSAPKVRYSNHERMCIHGLSNLGARAALTLDTAPTRRGGQQPSAHGAANASSHLYCLKQPLWFLQRNIGSRAARVLLLTPHQRQLYGL